MPVNDITNPEYILSDFTDWTKATEIAYNNDQIRLKEKYRFFQQSFDYLSANYVSGDYFEFGCHKTRTFRMSLSEARKKGFGEMSFYAFDSFEGLPEASEIDQFPDWEKGKLKTSIDDFDTIIAGHGLYLDKVHKVKGFFDKTLTAEFQQELVSQGTKIALAYIDSDFYESAVSVLDFIDPLLQDGAIICFDDWNNFRANPNRGEKKAFSEFKGRSAWNFEEFMTVGWFGKSFISVK